jgi:hypothetical protein
MKHLRYLVLATALMASVSLSGLSQSQKAPDPSQKPPDPCAQFKTAPKGETAADKKKRQEDLKACTAKEKADAKASKQAPKKDTK